MQYLAPLALAALVAANPVPQATSSGECSMNYPGTFQIQVVNITSPTKRQAFEKRQSTALMLTLADGILKDSQGRIGNIVANDQFQFDPAPGQAGAKIVDGWSVCSNGSLAAKGDTTFYQCLSGTFYNLYDNADAEQCSPVHIQVINGSGGSASQLPDGQVTGSPAQEMPDGQITGVAVSQIADGQIQQATGNPVQQIGDGQVQQPTGSPVQQIGDGQVQQPTGSPVQQISDGQVQQPTGSPVQQIPDGQVQQPTGSPVQQIPDGQVQQPTGSPVQQIPDGQVQQPTGSPVQQIPDGQIQQPTGAPVSQIADGQVQAGNATAAAPAPAQYTGAAAAVFPRVALPVFLAAAVYAL